MTYPKVLLTGGTSPLGALLVPRLVASGHQTMAISRSSSGMAKLQETGISALLINLNTATEPPADCTTLLHLAGIDFAPQIHTWLSSGQFSRAIVVSSASAVTPNHPKRDSILANEHRLLALDQVEVTILRPTMIYGTRGDKNISRIIHAVSRLGWVPRAKGGGLVMPVFGEDVVSAILEILSGKHPGGTFPVAGPEPLYFGQILEAISVATDLPQRGPRLPIHALAKASTAINAKGRPGLHALQMLLQDRIVTPQESLVSRTNPPVSLMVWRRRCALLMPVTSSCAQRVACATPPA